jgi:hypothetical protein
MAAGILPCDFMPAGRHWRHSAAFFAVPLLAGGTFLVARSSPTSLVAANECAAAAEWIVGALAVSMPAIPVGRVLIAFNAALAAFALGIFSLLAIRLSGSVPAALAATLALATSPLLAPRLDPRQGLTLILTVLIVTFCHAVATGRASGATRMAGCLSLALLAAVLPTASLPAALLGAWLTGTTRAEQPRLSLRRFVPMAAALVLIGGSAAVATRTAPLLAAEDGRPPFCLLPIYHADAASTQLTTLLLSFGPYAVSLFAAGVWLLATGRLGLSTAAWWATGLWAVGTLVADARMVGVSWPTLTAAAVLSWLIVCLGLRHVIAVAGPGRSARFAALGLSLLLPLLQLGSWRDEPPQGIDDLGHSRLSLDDVRSRLDTIAAGSRLASEDALVDALAAVSRRASARAAPALVRAAPSELPSPMQADTSSAPRLYAFPLAARHLTTRGFRIVSAERGLFQLEQQASCVVAGSRWRPVPELTTSDALALVALRPSQRGPLVIYAALNSPAMPRPVDWRPVELRGFHLSAYATTDTADRARLARDLADDEAPEEVLAEQNTFVVRLELVRTPVSSRSAVVSLGQAPLRAWARVRPGGSDRTLGLCAAFAASSIAFAN